MVLVLRSYFIIRIQFLFFNNPVIYLFTPNRILTVTQMELISPNKYFLQIITKVSLGRIQKRKKNILMYMKNGKKTIFIIKKQTYSTFEVLP